MPVRSNVKWMALNQSAKIAVQLVSLTVLARLLDPSEFGLMAMALVVTNFSLIVRDLGTAAAIVQRKELTREVVSTVFWLNLIMGGGICFLLILSSPLAASFFDQPKLTLVLILLALSFPVSSLSAVHQSLLERDSNFRAIATVEITAATLGLVVAICLALWGAGIYSLVGQALVTAVSSSGLLWYVSNWRPSFIFKTSELKNLLGFSGNLTGFNILNYFSRNADSIVIGYYFSAAVLGAYSLAYRVMLFPLQSLTVVATRSLYPLMSRQQDDPVSMAELHLRTLTVIASITAPMMAGLAILREPFVYLVFGEQWALVSTLLLCLAPTGFIQSLTCTCGHLFMAKGRTALLLRLGVVTVLLEFSAFYVGAQYSVELLALLYLIANVINATLVFYLITRLINISLSKLASALIAPLCNTVVMCAVLLSIIFFLPLYKSWINFSLLIFIGMLSYITSYRCFFYDKFKLIVPEKLRGVLWL